MKNSIITFLMPLTILCGQSILGQTNYSRKSVKHDSTRISGTYEGLICFRGDCLDVRLKIKKNNKYTRQYSSNVRGVKSRRLIKGAWTFEEDILTLIPNYSKKSLRENEILSYKMHNGNLYYYSKESLKVEEVALKRK